MKLFLIKQCLIGKCQFEDNYYLSKLQKLLHIVKAIICILFTRRYTGKQWNWYSIDFITVSLYNFTKFYNYEFGAEDATYTTLSVGYGWRNWWYFEMEDGWL